MLVRLALTVLMAGTAIIDAQSIMRAPRKIPGTEKPACSKGAICFAGRVSEGQQFRRALNDELEFVLSPDWTIMVVPKRAEGACWEFASVVNPPYRAHRDLYINMSYGWTAEEEVADSPREFEFVTNCADFLAESERLNVVLWPYTVSKEKYDDALAKLGTSKLGKGRLWITGSKVSHARDTEDEKLGKIEWMSFSVEVVLPVLK